MRRKLTQFPDIIDYQKFFGGEMKKEFNLATDSWIKLAGRPPVSLLDFFANDDAIVLGGTAIQKLVVFRLLLAILQASCSLEDEEEWKELTIEEMKALAINYLKLHIAEFALYDTEKPFLQHPQVTVKKEKLLPIGAFFPGVCVGNATVLYSSNILPETVSDQDTVYALLQLVTFGMGGKKPDQSIIFAPGYEKKSAPSSPALGRGWLHSFPLGDNIFETLKLNIFSEEKIEEIAFLKSGIGVPPWESMPLKEVGTEADAYTSSLLGWLVPISRFCRLEDGMVHMTSGVEYPKITTGLCDLSVSTKSVGSGAKKAISAVQAQTSCLPWRQLDAVMAYLGKGSALGCKSIQMRSQDAIGIWCLGMQVSDNSGEQFFSGWDDFVESTFTAHKGWIGTVFFENYLQEFCEINKLKGILYAAIMNYYKSMNAEDFGREFADRGVRNFWSYAEGLSLNFIRACAEGDPSKFQSKFNELILKAYSDVGPSLGIRQLMCYEQNKPRFKKVKEER